ncbi:MAG: hypothetical protein WAL52_15150 [Candidatus Sulfotelmatobacter sp.]
MPVSRGARAIAFGSGRFIKVAMSMILIASGLAAQTSSSSGSSVWQSNSPTPPPTSSNAGAGTLYKDAHGAFSIMIPEGWAARPNVGCYGPNKNNCPENASGVNIQSPGRSWAFLAPFSGDARQPTDVVKNVAAHLSTKYQNFQVLQNDPDRLNGLDIAIGHFTGIDQDGEGVSLVVIGIAAPDGRFFVAESSVPQSELQAATPALSAMPATLWFAGQAAINPAPHTAPEYETKLPPARRETGAAPGRVNITNRTRWVEIQDPAWGIVAARFQIPTDWNFDGILIRDDSCGLAPTLAWRISSPDGLYGAQMMPDFGSNWATNPSHMDNFRRFHCKTMEPISPEEFLEYAAPLVRPDPILGRIEPSDDAQQWQQQIDIYNQRSMAAFGTTPDSGGAVCSRIQYAYRGQTMEEYFSVRQQTFRTKDIFPRRPENFTWTTYASVRTIRAPNGRLDDVMRTLVPMLADAYKATPEWLQRFQQKLAGDTAANQAAMQRQTAAAQAQIMQNAAALRNALNTSNANFQKGQNDRFNVGQQQWQQHMDYMTRSAQAYTLYAGDNQLVRNPQTGAVSTVTNKYGTSAWQQDGTNNILLQNPNDINPNLYLRGTYTQLENVDPMKAY